MNTNILTGYEKEYFVDDEQIYSMKVSSMTLSNSWLLYKSMNE